MARSKSIGVRAALGIGNAEAIAALADPKLISAWKKAIGQYRDALQDETASWDKRYEVLGTIIEHDPPLFLGGGYQHLKSFLAAEAPDESERTIRSKIRVARYFAPADEVAYGVTRLDLLLTYLAAKGKLPKPPARVNPERASIELEEGATLRRVTFADASAATLRSATRELLSKSDSPKAKQPPVVAAIRKELGKAGLGTVTVSARGAKLTLGGFDAADLGKLVKALAAVKVKCSGGTRERQSRNSSWN